MWTRKAEEASKFTIESKLGKILSYCILAFLVFIFVMPLLIVINISLKTNVEYMAKGVFALPENIFNLSNYTKAFSEGNFGLGFKNTTLLIIGSVPIAILMGSMVAYALDRFEFKAKPLMKILFVIPTFVPTMTVTIATFTVIKTLGLYNTLFAGFILYIGTDIIQIYIFLQFLKQIPIAIDESAQLDGASRLKIYASIILPQMKPAIATVAILKVLAIYNDFFTPYIFMPKSSLKTVTTSLNTFAGDRMADWPLMCAAISFVAVPTIILYLFLQKYIIGGITDGAVK